MKNVVIDDIARSEKKGEEKVMDEKFALQFQLKLRMSTNLLGNEISVILFLEFSELNP